MELPLNESPESFHQELLEAQAHVWNHMFNFISSMSLKCVIQLGIPDIINKYGKPMTLSDLIKALPINKAKSDGIFRLMRILTYSKFFVKVKISDNEEKEGYWLTPASRLLLRDEPLSVAPMALAVLDPILADPWHHLGEWFQNESPTAFVTTHRMSFYELPSRETRLNEFFNEGMASDARLASSVLIEDYKHVFEGLKSMVDVGGGTGTVAKAIADAFPEMKCTVLDLPHVVAGLEGTHDQGNLAFVAGDMFKSIPPAHAVFLKWILHNWKDEECVQILRKCKEAISSAGEKGGKVMIVDMVLDDENKNEHEAKETELLFDLQMMVLFDGKQRTEKEWAMLFFDAGFTNYKITPALSLRSLIEVFP